ncbi:hypothetical protein ACWGJT_31960 [Streptomyces xantholiticus]
MTRRYLSWWRTGAATLIAQADGAAVPSRAHLPVKARLTAEPERVATVTARLYGPGEVTGLDARQVIRTEPVAGTTDFEPNLMCAVELDTPELPWMFTPAAADARGRLRPWLVLVVVRRDAAEVKPGRHASVLTTNPSTELPDLTQSWAWAHVQITGDGDPHTLLTGDPARSLSRLVCPRRLEPSTAYLAALVPAFRQGAQAGLDEPVDDGDLADAWTTTQATVQLPVYHSWEFTTGPAGDFEELVARLVPHRPDAADLAGYPVELAAQPGGVPAGGSMRVPGALGAGNQMPAPVAQAVTGRIAKLLDVSGQPVPADLPIALPAYGRWHAGRRAGTLLSGTGWFPDLALHPAARIVAGLGTRVVQLRQEELMAAVWAQAGPIVRANRLLAQGQLARDASGGLYRRNVAPLPDTTLLVLAGPAATRLHATGGGPIAARVAASRVPGALLTAAARRALRPRGPLTRAGGSRRAVSPAAAVDAANHRGDAGTGTRPVGEPVVVPNGMVTVDAVGKRQDLPDFCTLTPTFWDDRQPPPNRHVTALREVLVVHAAGAGPCQPTPPPPPLDTGTVASDIRTGLDPEIAVTTAVLSRLSLPARWAPPDQLEPVLAAPDIPTPLYREVAALAPDLLLPGVSGLPLNSVGAVGVNPWFVQAFLVGFNHELGRELLYRGYPTDQRLTAARRFWDRRGAVPPRTGAAADDITPITDWAAAERLGVAGLTPDAAAAGGQFVLVIRGDLLRRYPHTVVHLARAAWAETPGPDGSPVPELPVGAEEKYPTFGGTLEPDVAFVGFDLSPDDARGNAPDPGWYVVLAEQPTETRFGLDESAPTIPTLTWGDLSWEALGIEPGGHVTLDATDPAIGVDPQADPHGLHFSTEATSAQIAAILEQRRYRVALHARRLLLEEG